MDKSYFATAKPTPKQLEKMKVNRASAEAFAEQIVELAGGPSATTTLAIRKLQEAVMWANRSVLGLD